MPTDMTKGGRKDAETEASSWTQFKSWHFDTEPKLPNLNAKSVKSRKDAKRGCSFCEFQPCGPKCWGDLSKVMVEAVTESRLNT